MSDNLYNYSLYVFIASIVDQIFYEFTFMESSIFLIELSFNVIRDLTSFSYVA